MVYNLPNALFSGPSTFLAMLDSIVYDSRDTRDPI